jgi:tight adherence protein B
VRYRISLVAAAVGVALSLVAAAAGAAPGTAVNIAGFDSADYPHVIVNVITAKPSAAAPRLTENGAGVSGFDAVNLGAAKSVVVAIDSSRSMQGKSLSSAASAAQSFVQRKASGDRISVLSFGRSVTQLTGFSTSSTDAAAVLGGLTVDSQQGTALYDVVVAAAKSLRTSQLPGRVIVLLTDGRDVSSKASLTEAIAAARAANVSVYSIGIESRDFDARALEALARGTNGKYYGAGSSAALQQIYGSIAAELNRTWRLGYDTTARPGDQLQLFVRVSGVGTAQRTVTVPAVLGSTPAPSSPTGFLPSFAYSALGTLVLALIVGALVLAAVLYLIQLRRGSWVKQRLAAHVGEAERIARGRDERWSFLAALFRATEGAFGRRAQWRSIEKLLVRGEVPLRPAEFIWTMLGCAAGAGFVFSAAGSPALLTLAAMLGGGTVPYFIVTMRVRRRARAFENQLPDLLATIAATLKAGHSFKHGLQAVAEESSPPASTELRRVLTETGLGRPLDDALGDMADRVGSANFEFAITAVTIQRQVGGSLATLFDMVAETVRQRQQFARKIRSLTAMGRMSAYTLVAIPFFIAGMIELTNKGYLSPLFNTSLGHILLFVGMAMMAIGSLILKKIVSFKG